MQSFQDCGLNQLTQLSIIKSLVPDSNQQPEYYKYPALPIELTRQQNAVEFIPTRSGYRD